MMLVGGINWGWVLAALGAAGGGLYLVLFVIGYNQSRITYWLNPWADAKGKGWQLSQSLISIGSGGLWGLGLGKGRQKFLYLPEEHNDFIFAIVCEELGLIGASVIMLLFAALILRGYWIALHARDRFGSAAGGGLYHPAGHADVFEHRCGDGAAAHHGHLHAVFQLRRHGAFHSAGGDGRCILSVSQADEAYQGGVAAPPFGTVSKRGGIFPMEQQLSRVIFTCGGTAGHINPGHCAGAADARSKNPQMQFLFVGAERGLEKDLVPKAGYRFPDRAHLQLSPLLPARRRSGTI